MELQDNAPRQVGFTETMRAVETSLTDFYDLDRYFDSLRRPKVEPPALQTFERQRFSTHTYRELPPFYRSPTHSSGVDVTPISRFDITHQRLNYKVFRKEEERQTVGHSSTIRGVRAAVLASLMDADTPDTFTAPGYSHGAATAAVLRSVNVGGMGSSERLGTRVYLHDSMTKSQIERLQARDAEVVGQPNLVYTNAIESAAKYAAQNRRVRCIDPRDDVDLIAGQATTFLEYFAQLRAEGVDVTRQPINLRIGMEQGASFIGAAVVWKLMRRQDLIDSDSRLIGVQTEHNDAIVRALEKDRPLDINRKSRDALDSIAYPMGALTVGRRIVSVVDKLTDTKWAEVQMVPQEYVLQAAALTVARANFIPEFAGCLSLAGVLMDAANDELDQWTVEATLGKGTASSITGLMDVCGRYEQHGNPALRKAAAVIVSGFRAIAADRETASAATTAPSLAKALSPPVVTAPQAPIVPSKSTAKKPPAHNTKAASTSSNGYRPAAAESHRRGLNVWRGW